MAPKSLLVVEDSPRLRKLIVEEAIERFAGEKVDFSCRGMERLMQFGDLTICWCDTLEDARYMLHTRKFDGAVIDIGFPDSMDNPRLEGNRNGLKLVKELREGEYPQNPGLPVAVTSVEHVHSKIRDFFPDYSEDNRLTKGFFKGRRSYAFQGQNVFNSTASSLDNMEYDAESVAQEPVMWLANKLEPKKELDLQKVSRTRGREIDTGPKSFADRFGLHGWFPQK